MRICDYCNEEVYEGYLGYDIYVICKKCINDVYTKEEFDNEYENGNVFWTTFYDDEEEV